MSRARDMANGVTTFAPLASPDFTGTVDLTGTTVSLDDDEISGDKVSGGTIGAGTFNGTVGSSATFPAGHVIQVVGSKGSGYTDSAVTGMGASGLSQSITFTTGNKIFVTAFIHIASWSGGGDVGGKVKLYDETNSADMGAASADDVWLYSSIGSGGNPGIEGNVSLQALYTPPSGTSINIQVYWSCNWGGTTRLSRNASWISIMEIRS